MVFVLSLPTLEEIAAGLPSLDDVLSDTGGYR
jgi:hypothetical protein